MRLALAQLNVVVGDLDGNREKLAGAIGDARRRGADLVVLPELAVTGYPPKDLSSVRDSCEPRAPRPRSWRRPAPTSWRSSAAPWLDTDLANACVVCADGRIAGVYRKHFLPNYGVFDEHRYFAEGRDLLLLRFGDAVLAPTVCEDVWQPGPPATTSRWQALSYS